MRVMSALLVLATLQIAACAESGPDPSEERLETEEQRVLAAEDEYVAAEIAGDEATLRRLVDERFVLNGGDGTTSDKEALIRGVLAMDMTGQTLTDRSVLVDGALAVIFGTAELQLRDPGGQERVSKFRYTSVYVKRRDQWRMLALQMAPRYQVDMRRLAPPPDQELLPSRWGNRSSSLACPGGIRAARQNSEPSGGTP